MAKKEKQADELVMDLLTKTKNIFRKDIYIKNMMYIFGGSNSNESLHGDIYCVLEPKYILALTEFFGKHDLIYIDDIALIKKDYVEKSEDYHAHIQTTSKEDPIYKKLTNFQERVEKNISLIDDWKTFTTQPEEIVEHIFSDNSYVEFKDSAEEPYVVLCKKLFPLITTKSLDNVFYGIHETTNDYLNIFCVDYQFTHFRIYMVYHFIGLYQ